uniref:Uncharacterized protein n=1 Tax=Tanacetum cinerariifolium TaxID=118510 RepID=A0A699HHA5_TANCI|nr:hypothetical protein [Tanacetum cinerariifolium]
MFYADVLIVTGFNVSSKRIKKIHEELGIQSALPTHIPKQAPSQVSRRKRKHMELEPEVKICLVIKHSKDGMIFNKVGVDSLVSYLVMALLEGVPFLDNMVIEEPEYGIFFTDMFGDQAF